MNTFTFIFLLAVAVSFALHYWLALRQANYVAEHRSAVPDAFKSKVSLEAHQKAADYTLAKGKLGNIDSIISTIALLLFTLGGIINAIFNYWAGAIASPIWSGVAAIATTFFLMMLVDLPTSIYQTFVIEEKFGFNKNTVQQFVKDHILQLALSAAIGLPLLALVLWVMEGVGSSWWLWVWAIMMGFSLLISWLFPTVIAPLFNKFTPMKKAH